MQIAGLAFCAEARSRHRRLGDQMDDAAHRPGAVEIRPAWHDLNAVQVVRDETPGDPAAEAVVEQHVIQPHQCAPASPTVQGDDLSGRMAIATAETAGLNARYVTEQIVDLMTVLGGRIRFIGLRD